jgi:hypothetical protein
MIDGIHLLAGSLLRLFRTRRTLLLENLALRQQLVALRRRHSRPRLAVLDKLFWILARRFWSGWKQALIIVSPDTVVLGGSFLKPAVQLAAEGFPGRCVI